MSEKSKKILKICIFFFLLAWLGFLMAQKIDLATADLGRHLENGKWVVENHFNLFEKKSPVHENFYSYTNPDFQVPNHHWGSGVLFYVVYALAGFSGLSLCYILLSLIAFSIFFYIALRESNFTVAALLSLFLLPLIAERREVRPEIFSSLLAGIFFLALWLWDRKKISSYWLFVLPALMVFWVNLHVYFFLGLFLIGAFLFSEIVKIFFSKLADEEFSRRVKKAKILLSVFVLSALTSLINPFGFKGLIYPLQIFKNYGYTIVENKSVWFVENYGIVNSNFFLIKAVLALFVLSFVLLFFVDRKKISFPPSLFAVFFGISGWLAIRNFALLGFFALPVLAANVENIFTPSCKDNSPAKESGLAVAYIVIFVLAVFTSYQFVWLHSAGRGIGLLPGNEAAADFMRKENIAGPIFNNYDIGGYLIWNLPQGEKVFVDNRPEAYPDSFFSEIYKPMQEDPEIFKRIDEKYGFNAIVFSRNDITPWGMSFLETIGSNQDWTKVFEDNYAIIYLKNNEKNKDLKNRYQVK